MTWMTFFGSMNSHGKIVSLEVFMSVAHDEILKSALSLPEADRILLATELLDSVTEPMPGMSIDDPNLVKELTSRRASMDSSISASELFSRLDEIRCK